MASPDQRPSIAEDESILIAAFEGWNDAGSAASAALDHLAKTWHSSPFANLNPEDYHDFQVSRPTVSRADSGDRIISWPRTLISTTPGPWRGDRRISLLQGVEPSMRWQNFVDEVLAAAEDLQVTTLLTCGALLVDAPHSRPLPTYVTSEDAATRRLLNLERSDYEGPTGITGILGHEAQQRGITVVSAWVGVPHYMGNPPSPMATLAILTLLERLLGDPIDRGDLEYQAEAWQRGVSGLASEDDEVAAHVRQLEDVADMMSLPEASGEAIAAEFERFLWG
ncbi:MAG: PAC2 family protein, partial [Demequinaceae bacterium]|nr:PAC2 family protein [Demequinaceae bacterium]